MVNKSVLFIASLAMNKLINLLGRNDTFSATHTITLSTICTFSTPGVMKEFLQKRIRTE